MVVFCGHCCANFETSVSFINMSGASQTLLGLFGTEESETQGKKIQE